MLLPYQLRVVEEEKELEVNIKALQTFLSKPLLQVPLSELERLEKQLLVMREYARILRERIEHFKER